MNFIELKEDEREYCYVCACSYLYYSYCRHLFWLDDVGDVGGSGSDNWSVHRRSFEAVLNKVGRPVAERLLEGMKAHRYYFQVSGFVIGGGGSLQARLPNGKGGMCDYGGKFTEAPTEEDEAAMSAGVQWLLSLWSNAVYDCPENETTPDADKATAEWIEK